MPDSPTPPNAVFVSYAREDTAAAQRIAEALRSHGVEVWFDQNELRGGDTWDQKIRRQINDCALFVPIISQHTQARSKGYFRLEWKLAVEQTHLMMEGVPFLAPVVIDDTLESGAAVPPEFMRVQWTRLPGALPTTQFVGQVKRLLAPTSEVARAFQPVSRENTGSKARATDKPRLRVGLLVAVAVIAIGLATTFFATRKSPAGAAKPPTDLAAKSAAKSIAVLPFVNLGADRADEYLGDGMTEELLNLLAKVKGLRVPGRTSSFAFKGRTEEGIFRKVGEQLHVGTVLEGSVRKVGNTLRITAQLINVADGFHLWSETYDRDMTDILAIQSDVAQRVVQALQVQLGIEETRALTKKPTTNLAAYELYLKGRFSHFQFTEPSSKKAIECFNQAIALDPAYAQAHAGMAAIYAWISSISMPPKEAMPIAKRHVIKALELDESLAEAHHSSANIKWWSDWDSPGAEREFKRTFELSPNEAKAYDDYADFLASLSRFDDALRAAKKAADLDPQWAHKQVRIYYYMRRYDQAYAMGKPMLERSARPVWMHDVMSKVCVQQGKFDEAVSEAQIALNLSVDPNKVVGFATILAKCGKLAEARKHLDEINHLAERIYVSPVQLALFHEALGDRERAFALLQTAYEGRSDHLLWLSTDPAWDSIRPDPRFQALLKKVGLIK